MSENFPLPLVNLSGESWVSFSAQDKGGKVQREGNRRVKMNVFRSYGECYEKNAKKMT